MWLQRLGNNRNFRLNLFSPQRILGYTEEWKKEIYIWFSFISLLGKQMIF